MALRRRRRYCQPCARRPSAASATMRAMRSARVASRAALTTHHSICLRALGGKASHARRASGSRSSAGGQLGRLLQVFDGIGDRPPAVGGRGGDDAATRIRHQSALLHVGGAPAVQTRPRALRPTRRVQLQTALLIEDGGGGVDPSEADGLLDGIRIRAARPARGAAPRAQPHAPRRRVVLLEPLPPLRPRLGMEDRVVELPRRRVVGCRRRGLAHASILASIPDIGGPHRGTHPRPRGRCPFAQGSWAATATRWPPLRSTR